MKRLFIYVLLACTFGNVAIAQNASKELVSQRIVNAINKGKFYMKVSLLMSGKFWRIISINGLRN